MAACRLCSWLTMAACRLCSWLTMAACRLCSWLTMAACRLCSWLTMAACRLCSWLTMAACRLCSWLTMAACRLCSWLTVTACRLCSWLTMAACCVPGLLWQHAVCLQRIRSFLNDMRYINSRFTYPVLTYLLTYRGSMLSVFLAHRDSIVAACCLQVRNTVIITEGKLSWSWRATQPTPSSQCSSPILIAWQ